jgi:APA family basic amino acid/polyamine antiporter
VIETPYIMPIWENLSDDMTSEKKKEMETLEEWLKASGVKVRIEFIHARDATEGIIDYIDHSNVKIVLLGELEGKPSPTVDHIKSTVDVPILTIKNLYRA